MFCLQFTFYKLQFSVKGFLVFAYTAFLYSGRCSVAWTDQKKQTVDLGTPPTPEQYRIGFYLIPALM